MMFNKLQDDLFDAIWEGDLEAAKEAVDKGADVTLVRPSNQETPLGAAVRSDWVDLSRWLLDLGVNVNAVSGNSTWPVIFSARTAEMCELLLDRGADINVRDRSGCSVLMSVARGGDLAACELVVQRGADVHAVSDSGATALHAALWSGGRSAGEDIDWQALCRYFLRHGLSPAFIPADAPRDYLTPFQYAVKNGYVDIVAMFCDECSGDPSQTTLAGRSMRQLANHHWKVKDLLRQRSIEYAANTGIVNGSDGSTDRETKRARGLSPL
jgi:ankyrin repeat protein